MYFESIFLPLAFPSYCGLRIFGRKVWQLSHMELTWMPARKSDKNMTRAHSHTHIHPQLTMLPPRYRRYEWMRNDEKWIWTICSNSIIVRCELTRWRSVASEIFIDFAGVDSFTSSSLLRRIYFSCDVYAIHNLLGRYMAVEQYRSLKWKKISTHNEGKDIHAPLRLDGFTPWLCLSVLVCCKLNGERKNKTAMWIKQTGINLEVVPWLCNNPAKSTRILIGQPLWVSAGILCWFRKQNFVIDISFIPNFCNEIRVQIHFILQPLFR